MALRKRKIIVSLNEIHEIALCVELALEWAIDLSYDSLHSEWISTRSVKIESGILYCYVG
jgi:hypothetical protein